MTALRKLLLLSLFILVAAGLSACGADEERQNQLRLWDCLLQKTNNNPPFGILVPLLNEGGYWNFIQDEVTTKLHQKLQQVKDNPDRYPSTEQLQKIIYRSDKLKEAAGQLLLKHPNCQIKDAMYVMDGVSSLKEEAKKKILGLPAEKSTPAKLLDEEETRKYLAMPGIKDIVEALLPHWRGGW